MHDGFGEFYRDIGKLVYMADEEYDETTKLFKVKNVKMIDDEPEYEIQSLDDPSNVEKLSIDEVNDSYKFVPPPYVLNQWERFQSLRVCEGVWFSQAPETIRSDINRLVDEFAAAEPVDFHPGTKNVVRDLVHPSLYPLIIDPASIDTNMTNRWGRSYEKSRFQWLPTEIQVDECGSAKFVSPVNNLDTVKYPDLTRALEQVFSLLLPGLEQVWKYSQIIRITEDEWSDEPDYCEVDDVSFKGSQLQAVVKIADYEFAPGATFDGVWHYEGMSHENIAMTGLFYPNSDERLGGGLEFKREFTDNEGGKLLFNLPQMRPNWVNKSVSHGYVPLGWTSTETGKLMVFPNCHAHRVLNMVNNTEETLRRRLVVFFVIDPERRIPSSQDHNPMPRKISLDQALADRLELMQERKKAKEALNPREIELCEH